MFVKKILVLLSTTSILMCTSIESGYSMDMPKPLLSTDSPLKGGQRTRAIVAAYGELQKRSQNGDTMAQEALREFSQPDQMEDAVVEYDNTIKSMMRSRKNAHPSAHGASNGIPGNLTSMTLLELKNLYLRAHSASKEPNVDTSQWLPQQYIKEIERLIDVLARKGIAWSGPVVGGVGSESKQMDADKLTIAELQTAMNEISTKQVELYNKNPKDPEIDKLQARYEELEKFFKLRTAEYEKAEAKKAADIKNAADRERIRLETEAKKAADEKLYQTIVNNPKFQIPALPTDKERIDFLGLPATSLEFLISAPENLFLQIMENFKLSKGIAQKIDVEANADLLSALHYRIDLIKSYPANAKNSYELLTSSIKNQLSKLGKGNNLSLEKPKGVPTTPDEEQNYQDLLAYFAQKNLDPKYIQQVQNSSVSITALSVILFPNKPRGPHTYQTIFNSIDKSLTPFEWKGVRTAIKKGEIKLDLNHLEIGKLVKKIDETVMSIENGAKELNKSAEDRYKSQQAWILAGRPTIALPPPAAGNALPPAPGAGNAPPPSGAGVVPPPPPKNGGPMKQTKKWTLPPRIKGGPNVPLAAHSMGKLIEDELIGAGLDASIANEVGEAINAEKNMKDRRNASLAILIEKNVEGGKPIAIGLKYDKILKKIK